MSKQLLTLGIVLSLGTLGCAGAGIQQGPTASAHVSQEQGISDLWHYTKARPTQGLEAPLYAGQHLDGLWDSDPARSIELEDAGDGADRRGTGLFTTAFGQELAAPESVRF
jgi:hypothetical protein